MSRNIYKYMHQTSTHLMIGGTILFLLIGTGLIYLIYGQGAAFLGLLCILVGLFPILLIYLSFWIIEKVLITIHKS
jgi:hypothetical protein